MIISSDMISKTNPIIINQKNPTFLAPKLPYPETNFDINWLFKGFAIYDPSIYIIEGAMVNFESNKTT